MEKGEWWNTGNCKEVARSGGHQAEPTQSRDSLGLLCLRRFGNKQDSELLQRWKINSASEQAAAIFNHPHCEIVFS